MIDGLLLAAQVENVSTRRDGTLKLTLGCQELNQSKAGELLSMQNKVCAIYISLKESVPQKVIDMVDDTDVDMPGKTKSQRMRSVYYRIWEVDKQGHKSFESFYSHHMEKQVQALKDTLESLTT
jgi:hypothetical protein